MSLKMFPRCCAAQPSTQRDCRRPDRDPFRSRDFCGRRRLHSKSRLRTAQAREGSIMSQLLNRYPPVVGKQSLCWRVAGARSPQTTSMGTIALADSTWDLLGYRQWPPNFLQRKEFP
jgi:hypothetical protein